MLRSSECGPSCQILLPFKSGSARFNTLIVRRKRAASVPFASASSSRRASKKPSSNGTKGGGISLQTVTFGIDKCPVWVRASFSCMAIVSVFEGKVAGVATSS